MKDIIVHVDRDARCEHRVKLAMEIAKRFKARLTGVFAQKESHGPSVVARHASDNLAKAAADAEQWFNGLAAGSGLTTGWHQLPYGEEAFIVRELAIVARFADLFIFGQHEPDAESHPLPADTIQEVILQSGRPVMVVPYAGHFASVGDSVLVAWNGSREATRAVHDAMPMMERAKSVRVVGLHAPTQSQAQGPGMPKVNVIDHLAAHGINAHYEVFEPKDIGVMDMLLSRAADEGCDLIVMGAHGNYGFPFFKKGAGTRHVLSHMTVPVIFSC